jgi:DnaK suppressor protein
MSRNEIVHYRKVLDAKHAELIANLRRSEGLSIERVADAMDEIVFANERDLLIETLNRQTDLLSQLLEALQRTEDGCYGVCIHCSDPISGKRLNAVPWAALCLRCQERADHREGPAMSRSLPHAA